MYLAWTLATLAGLCVARGSTADDSKVPDITGKLQLFVDQRDIESLKQAHLVLHSPVRKETAIRFDASWETPTACYVTILQDVVEETNSSPGQPVYRMYYRGRGGDFESTCYAESRDGIHWTKPELGLIEWNGSKRNNMILASTPPDRTAHNFVPFRDTNPQAAPDARYKAVAGKRIKPGEDGLHAFKSADGIHWKPMMAGALPLAGKFDSQNVVYWDTARKKYVIYFRTYIKANRAISMAESEDFLTWSSPVQAVVEGEPEQFYTNAVIPYFRASHLLFAFPKRFIPDRKRLQEHPQQGISDAVFLSSRDGRYFDRQFREALLRPGRSTENWGDRSLMTAWGLVPTGADEMSIYVSEGYRFDSSCLTRFAFRTDGIASVRAFATTGELITKPFQLRNADKLVLNFATSAAGSVQVEVQTASGKPIPGFTLKETLPLYGDEIAERYAWKSGSSLSSLAGRPLRLRIVLNDADLYSYRFEK
ncbi:MAG TPA: hypothetical protein VNQ76_02035 [Planctomicrobium sp.]|nr:hypothetical protein [Planctomicrobium sp.]